MEGLSLLRNCQDSGCSFRVWRYEMTLNAGSARGDDLIASSSQWRLASPHLVRSRWRQKLVSG